MHYNSNDPFEAFKVYNAVKLHFDSNSYDYFKYNGKTSVTAKSFFMRRDKFFFAKAAKKYELEDLKDFYACNFAHHGTKWIGDLNDGGSDETYKSYKALMESFTYRFKNDIDKLLSDHDFKSLFVIEEGQYPILVRKLLEEELPLETFVVLNRYIRFMPKFDRDIVDPILWTDLSRKIRKYDSFILVNKVKVADVLKDCLQSNVTVI